VLDTAANFIGFLNCVALNLRIFLFLFQLCLSVMSLCPIWTMCLVGR